ncbi:MAG: HAD-IIIA family hydrolase [Nocardioidaceae bacterium]|nr:HAD-IIIA family hydrolase [Nocardioidaceae bacterium]
MTTTSNSSASSSFAPGKSAGRSTLPTTVVVPTLCRPSLQVMLDALANGQGPPPAAVIVVDDRHPGQDASPQRLADTLADLGLVGLRVVSSGGGGPARARNIGWRLAATEWVSFLDDDVVPDPDWRRLLAIDLAAAGPSVAGSQGRVRVPQPSDRRPTDWERSTAGLASSLWITADMTYRRSALSAAGGFDERFPRAFREDADLGLRISASSGVLTTGQRWITHPIRPTDDWVSVRQQRGNADDQLMRRLHGTSWRSLVNAPEGRRSRHLAVTAAAAAAVSLRAMRRRRLASLAALTWLGGTAEFAYARIAPGPRNWPEVRRMLTTSAVIPFAAAWHTASGTLRHWRAQPWRGLPELVLFDRDGTLVHDVPYNGDPNLVSPVHGAAEALDALRSRGVRTGVITNQSAVGTGAIGLDQMLAVNRRVEDLLGPFDLWRVCPHGSTEGCACRKPAPGMVKDACQTLGVDPGRCVVIGDIASDVDAAQAAGAVGILVPTPATRVEEVSAADRVSRDLTRAVEDILAGRW